MTVLTVEGQKYYSADVVVEKRGDLFTNGKPRSIFLNKKVEIDKEKDCLFFYLKEDKWVVTTPKYPKATVFFSGEWLKKMKIKADGGIEVEIKEEVAGDIKPKRKHERIKPVHNLTFEQLMKGNAQETIKEVELTKEQREKMVGLAYEKLTDKYYRVKYLNLDLIMDTEGYCNATNMCILGGKEFAHWKRTKSAKEYLNALQKKYPDVVILYQENSHDCNEVIRGTYVHPDLIVIIGMWISTTIVCGISVIVNEWRKICVENNLRFLSLLSEGLQNAKENLCEEKQWQQRVFEKEDNNPQIEVQVKGGYIDVLTETKLIEIKNFNDVDTGIGQLLRYQKRLSTTHLYNNQELWLYIFISENEDEKISLEDKNFIKVLCEENNIFVKFLN